jgi:hypothetical protein
MLSHANSARTIKVNINRIVICRLIIFIVKPFIRYSNYIAIVVLFFLVLGDPIFKVLRQDFEERNQIAKVIVADIFLRGNLASTLRMPG